MPKDHAHKHNPKAPEFTDFTVAGTKTGQVNAAILKACHRLSVSSNAVRRATRLDNRFWDTRQNPHPVQIRAGYPTKRIPNPERIKKRGVPNSGFLKQFKIVGKVSYVLGEAIYTAKIYVLHATRGWKFFA